MLHKTASTSLEFAVGGDGEGVLAARKEPHLISSRVGICRCPQHCHHTAPAPGTTCSLVHVPNWAGLLHGGASHSYLSTLLLDQEFSSGEFCPLGTLSDLFGCPLCGEGATGEQWVEARDAANLQCT